MLGANVIFFKAFGDHYPFDKKDIEDLIKTKESLNGEILITTEKDWARIRGINIDFKTLACLKISFIITTGEKELFDMIKEKADSVLN